jgi:hypothetical protein
MIFLTVTRDPVKMMVPTRTRPFEISDNKASLCLLANSFSASSDAYISDPALNLLSAS